MTNDSIFAMRSKVKAAYFRFITSLNWLCLVKKGKHFVKTGDLGSQLIYGMVACYCIKMKLKPLFTLPEELRINFVNF